MPYLFMMLGYPGSGKSYAASWLSTKMHATQLRTDDMRLAMYGQDRLELHRDRRYTKPLHNAVRYVINQSLLAGNSVIFDANLNQRRIRAELAEAALARKGIAIVIHVQVPSLGYAERRVFERAAGGGHQTFEDDFVRRMAANLEPPLPGEELVITLDGTAPAEAQQARFDEQFAAIRQSLRQ